MPFVAQVATGQRKELSVFGNDYDTPDGTGVRDYIHVMDLAEAHLKALDLTGQGAGVHAINVGTGQGYSVLAGSDPLPFAGEECRPGCYHTVVEWNEPEFQPAAFFQQLSSTSTRPRLNNRPRRSSVLTVANRMINHKRAG